MPPSVNDLTSTIYFPCSGDHERDSPPYSSSLLGFSSNTYAEYGEGRRTLNDNWGDDNSRTTYNRKEERMPYIRTSRSMTQQDHGVSVPSTSDFCIKKHTSRKLLVPRSSNISSSYICVSCVLCVPNDIKDRACSAYLHTVQ